MKYGVVLALLEKNFSIDWDNVTPDLLLWKNSYFGICAIINNNNKKKILKQNKR